MRVIAADGGVSYVDDIISAEFTQAAETEGVSQVMGSGSEATGITWSDQQRRDENDDGRGAAGDRTAATRTRTRTRTRRRSFRA